MATKTLPEAELALKRAIESRNLYDLALASQAWLETRFPEKTDWAPWKAQPGDYFRWKHHINQAGESDGKIGQVREIARNLDRFRAVAPTDDSFYNYWYDMDTIQPWIPKAGEWVKFRGGHALAGYSYVVTLSVGGDTPASGTLVRLRGIEQPKLLHQLMPCLDAETRDIGPGGEE